MEKPSTVVELFEKPNTWIRKELARNSIGDSCPVNSSDACQFCLAGAVRRIYGWGGVGDSIMWRLHRILGSSIELWNDNVCPDQGEVLKLCKKAGI